MAFGIGSSGFAQAGIELVVIRAAAAISQLRRFTSGLKQLQESTIKAAIATARQSAAFKLAGSERQFLFAQGIIQEQRAADRAKKASAEFLALSQAEQDAISATMEFRLRKLAVVAEESDAFRAMDTARQKEILATKRAGLEQQALAVSLAVVASVGVALAAVLNGITGELIRVAAESEAAAVALEHLGSAAGLTSSQVDRVQKAVEAQLFTAKQASRAIGTLITANVDYRHAVFLAALANDIATARGLDAVRTYDLLNRAVAIGTVTILRSLSVYTQTSKVLEAYARSAGIVGRELTQQERSMAVLAFLYKQSAKFAGAFSKAQGTVAFQTRLVAKYVEQLETSIGGHLLPIYVRTLETVNGLLATMSALSAETKKTIAQMLIVGTVFAVVVATLATIAPLVALLAASFKVLGGIAAVKGVLAIAGVAAVGAASWLKLKDRIEETTEATEKAAEATEAHSHFLDTALMKTRELLEMQVGMIKEAVKVLEDGVKTLEAVRSGMTKEMEGIEDAMFDLDWTKLDLDRALQPIEDALFLFEAGARKTIIPLQRQERALQRVVDLLRQGAEEEKKRREAILKALKKEVDAMKEKVELAEEVLEATNHEIFMEELRNKILKKSISGRLLELRGEAAVEKDNVARLRKELEALRKKYKDEKDRLASLESIAEKMLEAAEKQLKGVQDNLGVHQELLKVRQEDLELARLEQAEMRLANEQGRRARSEERFFLDRRFTLLRREEAILDRQIKQREELVENLEKMIASLEEGLVLPEPDIDAFSSLTGILDGIAGTFEDITESAKETVDSLAGVVDVLQTLPASLFITEGGNKWGDVFGSGFIDAAEETIGDWIGDDSWILPPALGVGLRMAAILVPGGELYIPIVKAAWDLGIAVVDALLVGTRKRWETGGQTELEAWAVTVVEAIENAFGVKSPAKTTIPIGESIMDGVIVGMEVGAKRMAARIPMIFAQARQVMANQAAWTANIGINESALAGGGGPALVSGGVGMGGGATSIVNNNYFTTPGPTLNLNAHYANRQSFASITEDVELMMDLS